jgi:hypothetical protein
MEKGKKGGGEGQDFEKKNTRIITVSTSQAGFRAKF